jgi:hypothetical protein
LSGLSVVVLRLLFAYILRVESRSKLALLIAASLIAAVRTVRDEIRPSPKVVAAVSDSIRSAKMLLEALNREA